MGNFLLDRRYNIYYNYMSSLVKLLLKAERLSYHLCLCMYCMVNKFEPIIQSNSLYKMVENFLDIQYIYCIYMYSFY